MFFLSAGREPQAGFSISPRNNEQRPPYQMSGRPVIPTTSHPEMKPLPILQVEMQKKANFHPCWEFLNLLSRHPPCAIVQIHPVGFLPWFYPPGEDSGVSPQQTLPFTFEPFWTERIFVVGTFLRQSRLRRRAALYATLRFKNIA